MDVAALPQAPPFPNLPRGVGWRGGEEKNQDLQPTAALATAGDARTRHNEQPPCLELRKTEVLCMVQGAAGCLGCSKSEMHRNTPLTPPALASRRTREVQCPTFW